MDRPTPGDVPVWTWPTRFSYRPAPHPGKSSSRVLDRLDRYEVEQLVAAAYRRSSLYGLLVKTLFYTGARVSELTRVRVEDVYFDLDPPQVRLTHAKQGSLWRGHDGRTLWPAERATCSKPTAMITTPPGRCKPSCSGRRRMRAFKKHVHPHLPRHKVATVLLAREMPIDQVRKFLRHRTVTTTQISAETSTGQMGRSYLTAPERSSGVSDPLAPGIECPPAEVRATRESEQHFPLRD